MCPRKVATAILIALYLAGMALLLSSCASSQKLSAVPNIAPVRESNRQTQASIKATKTHVEKTDFKLKEQGRTIDILLDDLNQLLK